MARWDGEGNGKQFSLEFSINASRMRSTWKKFSCLGYFLHFHFSFSSLGFYRESTVHIVSLFTHDICVNVVAAHFLHAFFGRFAPNSYISCRCQEFVLEVILFAISTCVLYSFVLSHQNRYQRGGKKIAQEQNRTEYESLTKSRPTPIECFIIANHRSNGWLRELK